MVNEKMDVSKLYEWVVIEHRTGVKNGGITRAIKSLCVTEPVRISEMFFTGDSETCPALTQRITQLNNGDNKVSPEPGEVFRVGNKFWAKVQPTIDSDGTVRWMFSPYSFTMQSTTKVSSKPSVDEVVTKTITDKVPYQDALKQLASYGTEYVKEYRKRMSNMGVKQ